MPILTLEKNECKKWPNTLLMFTIQFLRVNNLRTLKNEYIKNKG